MATTVEIGAFTGLTLDDPVLGKLDENPLDGAIQYFDVSAGLASVSVSRGRSRDLERTNAGRVSASFRNETRDYDPQAGGAFSRFIVPRLPIRVRVDGDDVFTGLTEDWNFTFNPRGQATASVEGSDGFALFAREINSGGTVAEQLTGARIEAVLDALDIPWPVLDRDIDTGQATLGTGVIEGNVLTYLQDIETSEGGLLFMDKSNNVTFRERLLQPGTAAPMFTDSSDGIPYVGIQIDYGTELLANDVRVISAAGTATATNASSKVTYGVTTKEVNTLLAAGSLQALADYILFRYQNPEYRISAISVNLNALDAQDRQAVLDLELGQQADVVFWPNRVGEPISVRNRVIGINHDISPDSHIVSFSLEALAFDFFVLNDPVFGTLDNTDGVLGF